MSFTPIGEDTEFIRVRAYRQKRAACVHCCTEKTVRAPEDAYIHHLLRHSEIRAVPGG